MKSQVTFALNQLLLLSESTNFSEFVSGSAAIDYWIRQCDYYRKNNIEPDIAFAEKNEMLWLSLRDKLRNTYKFLDLVIVQAPEIAPPLTVARNTYVQAVEQMNFTYADGNILRVKNGKILPENWKTIGIIKQIETLKKIESLIHDANLNIKTALKQK